MLLVLPMYHHMQLSRLCTQLDQLWSDSTGSVILYEWQHFLTSEALPFLGVGPDYHLGIEDPTVSEHTWDPRAVQGMYSSVYTLCIYHIAGNIGGH